MLLRDFVAGLDPRAAVETRVGLLVVLGGAVGVGGRALCVAGVQGLSGRLGRVEGCGERPQAAQEWRYGEGHDGEVGLGFGGGG